MMGHNSSVRYVCSFFDNGGGRTTTGGRGWGNQIIMLTKYQPHNKGNFVFPCPKYKTNKPLNYNYISLKSSPTTNTLHHNTEEKQTKPTNTTKHLLATILVLFLMLFLECLLHCQNTHTHHLPERVDVGHIHHGYVRRHGSISRNKPHHKRSNPSQVCFVLFLLGSPIYVRDRDDMTCCCYVCQHFAFPPFLPSIFIENVRGACQCSHCFF